MRLIDADKLLSEFSECNFKGSTLKNLINAQPTIDAVEVVRCNDCMHKKTCKRIRSLGIYGYCSEGERRETT